MANVYLILGEGGYTDGYSHKHHSEHILAICETYVDAEEEYRKIVSNPYSCHKNLRIIPWTLISRKPYAE
jgi:hypothetical protein